MHRHMHFYQYYCHALTKSDEEFVEWMQVVVHEERRIEYTQLYYSPEVMTIGKDTSAFKCERAWEHPSYYLQPLVVVVVVVEHVTKTTF